MDDPLHAMACLQEGPNTERSQRTKHGADISADFWCLIKRYCSAGNNFSLFTGHMSFQLFLLVGHLTNWTGHNLLTDNTLKKRTQDVLVRCSVIVSDHYVKLAGHFQNLVGQ